MEEELLRFLKNIGLAEIRFFESIDSTNSYALNWLENGAQDFSLVTADLQTAGRGRLGRRWVTRSGSALAFSLLIHPQPCEMEHLSLFPLLSALAVCRALEEGYGLHPQVKCPMTSSGSVKRSAAFCSKPPGWNKTCKALSLESD